MGRFIMLCGPSCVGKGPLHFALIKFFPHLAKKLKKLVLYNSRAPRPGEQDGVDYFFAPRRVIESFPSDRYLVLNVRGDLQALELTELEKALQEGLSPFFEGNPFIATEVQNFPAVQRIPQLSVFLSPLAREEILFLKASGVSLPEFISDVMRRKLLRRTQKQKGILSLKDLENIESRAKSAFSEMQLAHRFDYVLPNHDGEDSENWEQFYYPLGDARRTLQSFASILQGEAPHYAEKWSPDLLTN